MLLTENEQHWSNLITEELQVKDQSKLNWMSKYAQIHAIKEGLQPNGNPVANGIYSTPLNTLGMGNPMMPNGVGFNGAAGTDNGTGIGNTGADFHNPNYQVGSGDIPMSTLAMALEIAAVTIGFELVPVVPSNGPWAMLSYFDTPYAGGKLGRINETSFDGKGAGDENKPIYIKVNANFTYQSTKSKNDLVPMSSLITFDNGTSAIDGKFIGFSRIDNSVIIKVEGTRAHSAAAWTPASYTETYSIADVFKTAIATITAGSDSTHLTDIVNMTSQTEVLRPELVSNAADHVQGFANFFNGSTDPMTRAQNETGVGNTLGARVFTKMYQMGSYEVTGAVTRQQLQDMPLLGIDVIGAVMESMQNEISQHWNYEILDRVFKLGVTNAEIQRKYQGVDLNLYVGDSNHNSKALNQFPAWNKYVDIHNQQPDGSRLIPNAIQNTAAENVTTHQRRVMSRILAASNLIANVSRRGRANWVVMNVQMLSALQDAANFVVAPMNNTLTQGGQESLYFAGSVAGLNVYVDPYMNWDDTRICVGRKGNVTNGKVTEPGVVFQPYILADTVQITAEGTMAPKLLCNSRAAVVDCGFHPEQNYLTFMVATENDAYMI